MAILLSACRMLSRDYITLGVRKCGVVNGVAIHRLIAPGQISWFEYHCYEGHDYATLQRHSHQKVVVLGFADCAVAFTEFKERLEEGHQLLYRVRFSDGLEWDVFEDELDLQGPILK